MLEVNAIYYILLVEGFGLLLFLILAGILIAVFRLRRKGRAIRDLAARFNKRTQLRGEQTGAFLQAVYHLEDQDLHHALQDIDKHENDFFQLLVASLRGGKSVHIASLDGALNKLIESYKCLQPRADEHKAEVQEGLQDIAILRNENDELRSELSVAKNKLSDMIVEFGNMFGGGKDHELDLHELKKKLAAMQAGSELDINL